MPKRTVSYDSWASQKLSDPKIASSYLNAALEESSAAFFKALRRVAEAHQMRTVAEDAGVSRESLYRMTSDTANPTYASLDGILRALSLRLLIVPVSEPKHNV